MRKILTELNALALLRKQYGYNQADLINKGGFSQKLVQTHESLENPFEVMTMKQLIQYATFYKMTPLEFYIAINTIIEKRLENKLI